MPCSMASVSAASAFSDRVEGRGWHSAGGEDRIDDADDRSDEDDSVSTSVLERPGIVSALESPGSVEHAVPTSISMSSSSSSDGKAEELSQDGAAGEEYPLLLSGDVPLGDVARIRFLRGFPPNVSALSPLYTSTSSSSSERSAEQV